MLGQVRNRRLLWECATIAALLIGGCIWLWLDPPRDHQERQPQSRVSAPAPNYLKGATSLSAEALMDVRSPPPRAPAELATPTSVAISRDGRRVLSGSADGAGRLWDFAEGKLLRHLGEKTGNSARAFVHFDASGNEALLARVGDNRLERWDTLTGRKLGGFNLLSLGWALSVSFSADGKFVLVGGIEPAWDEPELQGRPEHNTLVVTRNSPTATARPGHVARLGFVGQETGLRVIDLDSSRDIKWRGFAFLWNTLAGSEQRAIVVDRAANAGIELVTLSPDGTRAVLLKNIEGRYELELFDAAKGKLMHKLDSPQSVVTALAVSPDGRLLYGAVADRSIRVWDIATGKAIRKLTGQRTMWPIRCIAFSRDGHHAVTGAGADGSNMWMQASIMGECTLWDTVNGVLVKSVGSVGNGVVSAAFAPDGRHLLVASQRLEIWDLETGRLQRLLR